MKSDLIQHPGGFELPKTIGVRVNMAGADPSV